MEKEIVNETSELNEEEEFVFPSKHYMPKELTQQTDFLKKFPEYDGRGTKIAILDTGVDPSCPGLQKTNEGKPKVIECCDLTGAGDVDTSTVKKADENGILIGLTERELKIPKSWKNPSGDWHLGTKPLHEVYSWWTKYRTNETKNEEFQKKNKSAISDVLKELNEHEKKVGSKSKKISDKEDREEINAKLEYLKETEKLEIESPVADCIVWNDGEKWKACIDLSFTGDLEKAKVMSSFHENQEYGFISDKCLVSYCLNIHDEGNLLEICVPNGSHGTHVAHIAAGHFLDQPEKDGLAPGAQIVSLCIGDLRKGSVLTEQALIRALNKCIELKVDVINYSYGAPRNCVDNGSFAKMIKNVVEKHGIIFVAGACNDGPALATMGFARGKLHHSAIYVGAYLTAEMKETMYSHHEASNSVVFPFSSRGPCLDGSLGVCIAAPGAAITGVPKHQLKGSELMNGTSMSSPNAAGNILCILSGMKEESIPVSPFRVKLALMNSAKMPEDGSRHPLSLGAGIIQILSAFELIKTSMKLIPTNLTDIEVSVDGSNKRGIYLRESWEVNKIQELSIYVCTRFDSDKDLNEVVNFECPIVLKLSHGSEEFVKYPKYSRLPSSSFSIHVNTTNLEPGMAHFAEVIGINPENKSLGPLFRIPVTIIIPDKIVEDGEFRYKKKLTLEPAIPKRVFIQNPKGSTYVKITIKSYEDQKTAKFRLQTSVPSFIRCRSYTKWCDIPPKDSKTFYFEAYENHAIEYCITQHWNNLNSSKIKATFEFYGFSITGDELTMLSTNPTNSIHFTNNLRKVSTEPTIEFGEFVQPLDPKEAIIEPMKDRDLIDGSKSFRLLLTYSFNVTKAEDYSFCPDRYYDYTEYIDCFLIQLSTTSKKHLYTTAFQRKMKLEKGDYVVRVYFRHTDPELLEKLKSLQILATQHYTTKVTGYLYKDARSALKGKGQRYWGKEFQSGESDKVYLESISSVYLPISYTAGSYLKGYFILQSSNENFSKYFSAFYVKYMVTAPKSVIKKESKVELEALTENDETADINQLSTLQMKNAIKDIEMSYITKETNAEKANALFEKLSSEFPTHLPIYSAEIQRLSKLKDFSGLKKVVEKLLEIAESNKVAEYFGVKSEFSEGNLRKKEIMEKKKTAIINALFLQANLGLDEFLKSTKKDIPDAFRNGFDPKEKPKEDIVKKDEKSADSKTSKDEAKAEVVEKEAVENVTATEKSENESKDNEDVQTKKVNDESSESAVSIEETSTDNEAKIDENGTTESVDEASKEDDQQVNANDDDNADTGVAKVEKNDEVEKVEEKETAELVCNAEKEKQEIVDKENLDPTEIKTPSVNSPGNVSRHSVSSDDSYEKVSDSGIDSDDKNDARGNLVKNESETESVIAADTKPSDDTSELIISPDVSKPETSVEDSNIELKKEDKTIDDNEASNNVKATDSNVEIVKSAETVELATENSETTKIKDSEEQGNTTDKFATESLESLVTEPPPSKESPKEGDQNETEKAEDVKPLEVTLEEVEKLYRHYMLFVDSTSENAKIIHAKYAVAHERFGTALSELQKIIIDQKTTSDYLSTEKAIIQLLTKLGWDHLAEESQKALLIKHQKFYRLF